MVVARQVRTAKSIPAIKAQPTQSHGGRVGVGGVLADGRALLTYGDYSANTGPIDVLALAADGEVSTLLDSFDTEEVSRYRILNGSVYVPSVDPTGGNVASLATNQGGTWHTVNVSIASLPVVTHLFDIALDPSSGDLLAAGAREDDVAFVWRSADDGLTWTEDLAHVADGGGFNRFYDIRHSAGRPVVTTNYGTPAHFVLTVNGSWSPADTVAFDPDNTVYVDQRSHLIHRTRGDLGTLFGVPQAWSASEGLDGSIWLADGTAVYYLKPPD